MAHVLVYSYLYTKRDLTVSHRKLHHLQGLQQDQLLVLFTPPQLQIKKIYIVNYVLLTKTKKPSDSKKSNIFLIVKEWLIKYTSS